MIREVCDTLRAESWGEGGVSNTEVPFYCIFNIQPAESDGLSDFDVRDHAFGHPRFKSSHRYPDSLSELSLREKSLIRSFRNSARAFVHGIKNRIPNGCSEEPRATV